MRSASIHQPTLLPWIGFFAKISKSDIYIVLDHSLNNPKDPQLLLRRTQLIIEKRPQWISLPVNKVSSGRGVGIQVARFEYLELGDRAQRKLLTCIKSSYCKCKYFDDIWPFVEGVICSKEMSLAERNIGAIKYIIDWLGLDVEIAKSSEMGIEPEKRKDEMIIEILKKVKADEYLHGKGAIAYQDPIAYRDAGIRLKLSLFNARAYAQKSERFVEGMSVVDAMMNVSKEELISYIMNDG